MMSKGAMRVMVWGGGCEKNKRKFFSGLEYSLLFGEIQDVEEKMSSEMKKRLSGLDLV